MTATVAAVRTTCFSLYIRRLPLWYRLGREGSSSGEFRCVLPSRTHPAFRLGSAAEAVQPKEIIDKALSSLTLRRKANILLHLLSVRSSPRILSAAGTLPFKGHGSRGYSKQAMLAARAAGLQPAGAICPLRSLPSVPFCRHVNDSQDTARGPWCA